MRELRDRITEIRQMLWDRRRLIVSAVFIGLVVGAVYAATSSPKTLVMVEIDPAQSGSLDIRSDLAAMGVQSVQWPNGQISVDLSYTPEDRQLAVDRRSQVEAYLKEIGVTPTVIERSPPTRTSVLSVALPAFLGFLLASCYVVAVGTFSRMG